MFDSFHSAALRAFSIRRGRSFAFVLLGLLLLSLMTSPQRLDAQTDSLDATWAHDVYYALPDEHLHLTLHVSQIERPPQSVALTLPPDARLVSGGRVQLLTAPRSLTWHIRVPDAAGRYAVRAGGVMTMLIVGQRMPSLGYHSAEDVQLIDGLGRGETLTDTTLENPRTRLIVGDWNGDNYSQLGTYHEGVFTVGDDVLSLPDADDIPADAVPLAGDWDGDGVDSPALYADGQFVLYNRGASDAIIVTYTPPDAASMIPLVGDWNGNGVDSVGGYRQGVFYLRLTTAPDSAERVVQYGARENALPLIGDWNGDGVDTLGVIQGDTLLLRDRLTPGSADAAIPLRRFTLRKVVIGYWQGADRPLP